MPRPGDNIAGDAKQVDACQAIEGTDACVESNGRALPEQFGQYRNSIVRIVIVVDGITRVPHIVGWKMGTAHYGGNEAFIHKHFKGVDIRHI